jgi:SAM-dependent methyltransferase
VLHVAPGPEDLLRRRLLTQKRITYLSIDIDPSRAMRQEDLTRLSFPDDAFDLIICVHVLEHIDDDASAIRELRRVLKPGGLSLIMVPIDGTRTETYEDPTIVTPEQRERAYWYHDHRRLYGCDFRSRLERGGFVVRANGFMGSLRNEVLERHALLTSEELSCRDALKGGPLYVCTKP